MSVSTTNNKHTYTGDGVNKDWAFTFPIVEAADVQLWEKTGTGKWTKVTSNYTVDTVLKKVTYPNSGSAIDSTRKVQVRRAVALTQGIVGATSGTSNPKVYEGGFDRATLQAQDLSEQLARTLRVDKSESPADGDLELPAVADRASKYLAFDTDGKPVASPAASGTPTTAPWADVIDEASIPAGMEKVRAGLADEPAPATDDEVILRDTSALTVDRITLANLLKVVSALTAKTTLVVADEILLYDSAGAASKKVTVENVLKAINALTAETVLAEADEIALYDASVTAVRKMTVANMLKVINALTAKTAPVAADELALYDSVGLATKKITVANLWKAINTLTAETAPDVADEFALYDASAGTADKIRLDDLFKVINSLTLDAAPDSAADYLVTYDASAAAAKKVLLSAVGLSAATQAQMEAASINTVAATPGTVKYHPGVAKAWVNFTGTGTPTIQVSHNVTSITDNGVGDYTVNFTTAFSSANYCPVHSGQQAGGADVIVSGSSVAAPTASAYRIAVALDDGVAWDVPNVYAAFFGDQ